MFRSVLRALAEFAVMATILAGLAGPVSMAAEAGHELVVYSGRKEPLILPVIKAFEAETGIRVVLKSGGASELANAILEERNRPRADVFISNDAGTLEILRLRGVLAPNRSPKVAAIPREFRAADGAWVGVSGRARVIMYNVEQVTPKNLPKSILDLTDSRWKGQVAISSSQNESLIAQITGMRQTLGNKATEAFLAGLLRNQVRVLKDHTEVRKAVGKGEFQFGVVNHYYYHLEKEEGSKVGVIYPDQGEDQIGALVNVAGVGIVKGARNEEAARRFVDYLLMEKAQEEFANLNYEIPLLPSASAKAGVKSLKEFKRMKVNLDVLGQELNETLDLVEKVGLP